MNNITPAIGFQSKLYSTRLIASHEALTFTDHKPIQRAMEIVIRFVNCDDLRGEFYCRRAELTRRYGCSDKHGTKLFRGMLEAGLIEVAQEHFDLKTKKYSRTFRLTESSAKIVEKSLMITEGIKKAARDISETICPKPKKINSEKMVSGFGVPTPTSVMDYADQFTPTSKPRPERPKRHRKKSPKKKKTPKDQPWMIARDLFGGNGYTFAEYNDCMEQVVENLDNDCARARKFFEPMYEGVDGHNPEGRRKKFARFCSQNSIYPRTRSA